MDGWGQLTETAEAGGAAKLCTQLIVLGAAAKQSFFHQEREAPWTQGPYCITQGYHRVGQVPGRRVLRLLIWPEGTMSKPWGGCASSLSSLSLFFVSHRVTALKTISLEFMAWREGCGEWEEGYDHIRSSSDCPQKTRATSRDVSREAGNLAWVTKQRETAPSQSLAWHWGGYAGHLVARAKAKGNLGAIWFRWYLNSLVVFPSFFNLSLNLAIRSSWSQPQSAPGLVFTDSIELLHLCLQRI